MMGFAARLGKNWSPPASALGYDSLHDDSAVQEWSVREQGNCLRAAWMITLARTTGRVIAAYVGTLDVAALGFRHADREVGAGQPSMTRPICWDCICMAT